MFVSVAAKAGHGEDKPTTHFDIDDDIDITFKDHNIWSAFDFPHYTIDIDFKMPETAQNELSELTLAVEAECPVGASFGVSGIGEGIVWSNLEHRLRFKVKGEKHSVTKVKKLAKVDVEKVESMRKFIEYAVTENRLKQAISEVTPDFDIKKMGDFIRWVYNDVTTEEADTMTENDIDPKSVGKYISNTAREWFMKNQPL